MGFALCIYIICFGFVMFVMFVVSQVVMLDVHTTTEWRPFVMFVKFVVSQVVMLLVFVEPVWWQ